jgi:hypothetical protein
MFDEEGGVGYRQTGTARRKVSIPQCQIPRHLAEDRVTRTEPYGWPGMTTEETGANAEYRLPIIGAG